MRSASMEQKSIPNCKRASSRISTRSSRPSRPGDDLGDLRFTIYDLRLGWPAVCPQFFPARKSPIVNRKFQGRVLGAWWPSRSSKPSSARFTGRGRFDSCPLRHLDLRFTMVDLRVLNGPRPAPDRLARPSPIVNRQSEGRCCPCHANKSSS